MILAFWILYFVALLAVLTMGVLDYRKFSRFTVKDLVIYTLLALVPFVNAVVLFFTVTRLTRGLWSSMGSRDLKRPRN